MARTVQPDRLSFDLRGLEVFLEVCDSGSMTTAARRLGMTQPAVSQIVRQIEHGLGVKLIDRKLRPLALTPAGGMLRQRGRELLAEARQIAPVVRQSRKTKLPFIRIGLVDSFTMMFGPPLASELRNLAAQLTIWSGLAHNHGAALLNRQLDLIVTSDALEDVDGVERFTLLQEPFILLLPGGHRSRHEMSSGKPMLARLAHEMPLMRYTARSHIGLQIDRHLRRLNVEAPRQLEFDTSDTLVAVVAAGLGWAITTPLCVLGPGLPLDRVTLAPLPSPGMNRRLTLVTRSGELGRLPEQVTALARGILRADLLPRLERLMPWVAGEVRVG